MQGATLEEGKREIAFSLLRQGVPVEVIAKVTGLSEGGLAVMRGREGEM
nr:hypothetical protein [Candidatus Electrothrix aestuarii]